MIYMDIIQEKLSDMEVENPSLTNHNQNFLQRVGSRLFFKRRNSLDIKQNFSFTSLYENIHERRKDYEKMIQQFNVNKNCLDTMTQTLFAVTRPTNPYDYMPGYGSSVSEECLSNFLDIAYELFMYASKEHHSE